MMVRLVVVACVVALIALNSRSWAWTEIAKCVGAACAVSSSTGASTSSRSLEKYRKYHWYELTDQQDAKLRAALKSWASKRQVLILSATADSLGLAEDFDSALNDTGHGSSIDRPMDTVDGAHCTDAGLSGIVKSATGIDCVVDPDEDPSGPIVINFGMKKK